MYIFFFVLTWLAIFISQSIAMQTQDLASIFLAILSLTFFSKVAELAIKYCFDDWVVEKKGLKKRPYLETIPMVSRGINEEEFASVKESLIHAMHIVKR